jgi:Xaa-Pro aminopeptidase
MALEDGTGVDFATLRAARRQRVLAAMADGGVDLLLLGRQGNARYVAGHRPIWRAVVTAWAPFCALQADGGVHLLHTTWDDGVPEEIPHEHLSGLSWSPRTIVGDIAAVPGLAEAKVVATDGLSSGLALLLGHLAPDAELVDGESLMRSVRAVKLPAEVECIRTAVALTEGALTTAALEIRAGVDAARLKGAFHEAMGRYGISHPNAEGRFGSGGILTDGDLVPLEGALAYAGYEAAAGRTRVCGSGPSPGAEWRAAMEAVIDRCRAGEAAPQEPGFDLYGVGLGVETLVEGEPLRAGMVLGIRAELDGYLGTDTVLITPDAPERLTHLSP